MMVIVSLSNRLDCRPEFVMALDFALRTGNQWDATTNVPAIMGPFLDKTKTDIARLGSELDVPFSLTWSCYKGGENHCGVCGTCTERIEAFRDAGLDDLTVYGEGKAVEAVSSE